MRNDPIVQNFYITGGSDPGTAEALQRIENQLANVNDALLALSDAVTNVAERVDVDVQHLQDLQSQQTAVISAMQAQTDADVTTINDQITKIADLQSQIDGVAAGIAANVSRLSAIDPLADNPVPPPAEPPVGG